MKSNVSSEARYTNSPSIKVYTSSDDPQGIGNAVSGAVNHPPMTRPSSWFCRG